LFFGLQLVSRIFEEFQHSAIQTKIVQHFGEFFHQIKVGHPIGTRRLMKNDEIGCILYSVAQNLLFSNIQYQNEK
jgi:hypothetical protein